MSCFFKTNLQKKKLEDKVEKYKKEVEITKSKYKQGLDDLNSYNSRYMEDMNTVRRNTYCCILTCLVVSEKSVML